jgi:hypothetical protein
MTDFDSKTFSGHHVVDGNSYRKCIFHDCHLVFRGGQPPSFTYCGFTGATGFTYEDAALRTLAFLSKMQAGGLGQLVVQVLDAIRNSPPPPEAMGHRAKPRSPEEDDRHQQRGENSDFEWFRFFKSAEHADDFVRGRLMISTLGACRGYEKAGQGDKDEGTIAYSHGPIAHGDPNFETVARRMGMGRLGEGTVIAFNALERRVPDAFVLCCTRRYAPEKLSDTFGHHCVRINYPLFVFDLITEAIRKQHEIGSFFSGKIMYDDRHYRDAEPPPADHAALVKPRDGYADQEEERMVWLPKNPNQQLAPFEIEVPGMSDYCERIA